MSFMVSPYRFAAAGAADPNFASVVLLLGFDGTDAATATTDESASANAITFVGNAQIDTAQKKFGTASLLLDGTGDYLAIPDSANWDFGAAAFTWECWVRFNTTGDGTFFGAWTTSNATARFYWSFTGSAMALNFYNIGSAVQTINSSAWSPSTGVWYHVVCERNASNVFRFYVDGVMFGKTTNSQSFDDTRTQPVWIGARNHSTPTALDGWLDELRITKGVALYDSDAGFTAPTAAFPRL